MKILIIFLFITSLNAATISDNEFTRFEKFVNDFSELVDSKKPIDDKSKIYENDYNKLFPKKDVKIYRLRNALRALGLNYVDRDLVFASYKDQSSFLDSFKSTENISLDQVKDIKALASYLYLTRANKFHRDVLKEVSDLKYGSWLMAKERTWREKSIYPKKFGVFFAFSQIAIIMHDLHQIYPYMEEEQFKKLLLSEIYSTFPNGLFFYPSDFKALKESNEGCYIKDCVSSDERVLNLVKRREYKTAAYKFIRDIEDYNLPIQGVRRSSWTDAALTIPYILFTRPTPTSTVNSGGGIFK